MNRADAQSREHDRRKRRITARPNLEGLEDRLLLYSADGGLWTYSSRITYSFMPDGTNLGGPTSNLYATMNAVAPTATWQAAIEKAAAIWESVANINLALVPDDGSAEGVSGNQQDDPRFGDIRIGAEPMAAGTLAATFLPPPVNGGTMAGDILFNSNIAWQINSNYDLETVAIHELGHALGMGHSAISSADMYAYYTGVKQTLTSDDTAGIQSLYGADPTTAPSNGTWTTATDLTSMINGQSQVVLGGQYSWGVSDCNWFKVTAPSNTTGTMTVTMQSTNLSSLSPRLAVYNGTTGTLVTLGQVTASNVYGATVTYTVNGVTPGQVYYFRASAANTGAGSVGAYGLGVNFGPYQQAPVPPPNTVVAQEPDQGGGQTNLSTHVTHKHGKHYHPVHLALHDVPDPIKSGNLTGPGDYLSIRPSHTKR